MQSKPIEKIRELTDKLNRWRHQYYNLNAPSVSDALYDYCFDKLQQLEQDTGIIMSNSPTQTVGCKAADGLKKTTHTIPLLSLEKTKQTSDLMNFTGSQKVMLMHKLDGLTVKLEYDKGKLIQASTRGDGDEGEVVTHNAQAIEGIPAQIPYQARLVIVGEVYISKLVFGKLKETLRDSQGNLYKNARNMAAGSIRSHDAASCSWRGLQFSPFAVIEGFNEDRKIKASKSLKLAALKRLGFSPCAFILLSKNPTENEMADCISKLHNLANINWIPIDGIVASYNDIPYSLSRGRTGHHYKDALAYKFEDDLHETVLLSIEWKPSRSGDLSPVALFNTVEIDGCEVSRASLHNLAFIKDLELMPGCRILVSRRNMIIPHIEENLDRGRFKEKGIIPRHCPCCGKPTRVKESGIIRVLRCDNPSCAMRNLRKFVHFVGEKAMDIENLSEATLEKFIGKGWLRDFTDIYRLDEHAEEIINMEGFGEKSWRRLWGSIQRSRNTTFERYVAAMDIPMVGRAAGRELSRYFKGSLNAFETACNTGFDFTRLNDFGAVLNRNIHLWFKEKENQFLWKELQMKLNIAKKSESREKKRNSFSGRTIVVTGKLESFTRDTINAKIESLGAKAGSSVSKNTDYLICGEKAGSKLGKASELGVTVLTEQEFLDMALSA
ncbi:MAG: NAD-dependent DNA ligase LigA [Treponema sp.]|jgi:DNA ligase (NAD+)|nr:NAD-dependent DNA ligase LigA [Treponema sp.]